MFNLQNWSKNVGNLDTKFSIIILVCKKPANSGLCIFIKNTKKKIIGRKIKGYLIVEFMAFIYKYFFFDFARDCVDWVKKKLQF